MSPSYEYRLAKYSARGLKLSVPDLDLNRVNEELLAGDFMDSLFYRNGKEKTCVLQRQGHLMKRQGLDILLFLDYHCRRFGYREFPLRILNNLGCERSDYNPVPFYKEYSKVSVLYILHYLYCACADYGTQCAKWMHSIETIGFAESITHRDGNLDLKKNANFKYFIEVGYDKFSIQKDKVKVKASHIEAIIGEKSYEELTEEDKRALYEYNKSILIKQSVNTNYKQVLTDRLIEEEVPEHKLKKALWIYGDRFDVPSFEPLYGELFFNPNDTNRAIVTLTASVDSLPRAKKIRSCTLKLCHLPVLLHLSQPIYDILAHFRKDAWDFPADLKWKVINPGEQAMRRGTRRIAMSLRMNDWYFSQDCVRR